MLTIGPLSTPRNESVLIQDVETIPGNSAKELKEAKGVLSDFAQKHGIKVEFADGRRLIGDTDVFIKEGEMAKRVAVIVKKDAQNFKTAIKYFGHPEPFVDRVFKFLTIVTKI